jgi:putative hemolysin
MMEFSKAVLALVVFFLFIEGFFSGSELALLSADKLQLKKKSKKGDRGAQLALRLLKFPERILSSTLVMTSTCVMTISVLLTLEFRRIYGEHGEVRAVLCGSLLVIIFGELIPKFFYRKFSAFLATKVAYPIFYMQKILSPFMRLASVYTTQIAKIVQPIDQLWQGKKQTGKDELQVLLTADAHETQIKSTEKRMIRKILKFRDKIAKDGLVPLVQVDAVERTVNLEEAFEIYRHKKHSRLPVYDDRIDNIVGVLELSHVIRITDLKQNIAPYIRPAIYVAESQKLENILNELLEADSQLAIVVDEYGGAVGILTREDIFEQIVGDLQDEDDLAEARPIRSVDINKWLVKAKTTIIQLNEELQLELPEGDYDTLSGFLLRQFSRIPEVDDELFFDTKAGQIHFVVREATSRKIETVAIERIPIET